MPIDPAQAVALLASIQWSRDLEKMSKTLAARFEREMKEVPLPLPCCAASPSVRSSDGLLQTTLKLTKLAETQDALHTDVNRKLAKLEGRLASASSDTQLAKVPMSVLDFCRSVSARQTLHPIHSYLTGQSGVCRGFQQSPGEVRDENDRNGAGTAPPGRDAAICHA